MKTVVDVEDGLVSFLGRKVLLMCTNYFYQGTLMGVNQTCVRLTKASIVYETGSWTDQNYADSQPLPTDVYVSVGSIEAFMESK